MVKEKILQGQKVIKELPLGEDLEKRLLERLESFANRSEEELDQFLDQLTVLKGWGDRLSIQAQITQGRENYQQMMLEVKKVIMSIFQGQKGEEQQVYLESIRKKLQDL